MKVEYFLITFIYFLIEAHVREIKRSSLKFNKGGYKKLFVKISKMISSCWSLPCLLRCFNNSRYQNIFEKKMLVTSLKNINYFRILTLRFKFSHTLSLFYGYKCAFKHSNFFLHSSCSSHMYKSQITENTSKLAFIHILTPVPFFFPFIVIRTWTLHILHSYITAICMYEKGNFKKYFIFSTWAHKKLTENTWIRWAWVDRLICCKIQFI